jgi:hypothetical protein
MRKKQNKKKALKSFPWENVLTTAIYSVMHKRLMDE